MAIGNCNDINVKNPNCTLKLTTNNWKNISVNESVMLPASMPDIRKVKGINATVTINSTNFIITPDSSTIPNAEGTFLTGVKLMVNGVINEVISYESGEACRLYSFSNSQPFNAFIVLDPSYNINAPVCIDACIDGVMAEQVSCREIRKNVAILLALN